MDGEKHGVLPIDDVKSALMYDTFPLHLHHQQRKKQANKRRPLQSVRNPPLLTIRTHRISLHPRPRLGRLRDVRALLRHLRAQVPRAAGPVV